jgi:hypothetical protein
MSAIRGIAAPPQIPGGSKCSIELLQLKSATQQKFNSSTTAGNISSHFTSKPDGVLKNLFHLSLPFKRTGGVMGPYICPANKNLWLMLF